MVVLSNNNTPGISIHILPMKKPLQQTAFTIFKSKTMTTQRASPLPVFALLLVFISSAIAEALDVPAGLPEGLKEFGALKDEVLNSNIINQMDGAAGKAANVPRSDDASALANFLKSAPTPGGQGKLDKMILQFNGPAPAAAAATNGDASALTNIFKPAPGPAGAGAVDALAKMFKRGPAPDAAEDQPAPDAAEDQPAPAAPPPHQDSGSTQLASSFLCVGMVGFITLFVAL